MTNPSQTVTPVSLLSDRKFDILRQSATIILPAIGALYFALGALWNLPKVDEIVGTVAALNVFAGVALTMVKKMYDTAGAKYDGTVDISVDDTGKKSFLLNLNGSPEDLDQKSEITFKVNSR